MQEAKKVTIAQLKAHIQAKIDDEARDVYIHTEIVRVLEKMEGKLISQRIATALNKLHPDWTVHFEPSHSMFHLKIWGGDTGKTFDNRVSVLLGYRSEPTIRVNEASDSRGFEYFDCCNGSAAIERNKKRLALIEDPDKLKALLKAINAYNQALASIEALTDNIPDEFSIQRELLYNGRYDSWRK